MKKLAVLLAAVLVAAPAFADNGILKLSLWDDIAVALPNNTQTVRGVDLGIGSQTNSIYGWQANLVKSEAGELRGINEAFGWSTINEGYGINGAFGYARSHELYGIQGAIYNVSDRLYGVQGGLISINNSELKGFHGGWINIARGTVIGAQIGIYNQVEDLHGFQLGIVNNARHISKGLQVGIVNIAKNGWFPVMVLVNGRF